MKITEEQKDNLKDMFEEKYESYYDNLANSVINDFIVEIENYDEDSRIENMIYDISGCDNGAYISGNYESAIFIAENIFEFQDFICDMQEDGYTFKVADVERNLMLVAEKILNVCVLSQNCETLGELINKLSK